MSVDPTEVLVIDSAEGATRVLSSYHPLGDSAHLLCRWPNEPAPAFSHRVAKCLARIRQGAEVAALTLVLGGDPTLAGLLPELSRDLASAIAPSGSVTLIGLGASQLELVQWLESLRTLVEPSVVVGAHFTPA
jgi:hypothetical protein